MGASLDRMVSDDVVANIKKDLLRRVQDYHLPPDQAARDLAKMGIARQALDLALEELHREQEANILVTPTVVDPSTWTKWYMGPPQRGNWADYREMWQRSGKPGLEELDRSTTDITGLLANPRSLQRRKGLVMGNVQSGKTGNFAGVAAKATDAGYRLIVVMGGLYNNLRQQTQDRLVHDVFHPGDPGWRMLTGPKHDIPRIDYPQHDITASRPTAAVVKKNDKRLQNLINVLRALPEETLARIPVLIIDDEADQATPNSSSARRKVSRINELMRELWSLVRVGTYLAYTATPFANVLMNPDDESELFPSDFITLLTPGPTYFGPERVFGVAEATEDEVTAPSSDGLPMVRNVPDDEADALRPPPAKEGRESFVPPIVPSLEDALRWFLIATTVRRLRGQENHSSMLVHTTRLTAPHRAMQRQVQEWLDGQREDVLDQVVFRDLWEAEARRVEPDQPRLLPAWADIWRLLPEVMDEVRVVVDNGESEDRLSYTDEEPSVVVAIGGGTLSRGLTLEGLVVSYFTRTTSTYDTLMQMGRWFGYRDGYEDLPRLWVSSGLDRDYAFLARVERDLRAEIESLANSEFTPAQVGVKIRQHPGRLEITSVAKMRSARPAQLSLSGTARQTFILDGSDPNIRDSNKAAVEELIGGRLSEDHGALIARGITSAEVVRFLQTFRAHEDQQVLESQEQKDLMKDWLTRVANNCTWSVVVTDNKAPDAADRLGTMSLAGHEVRTVNRAPLYGSTPERLDFKAVMSPGDWVADIKHKLPAQPGTPAERLQARRLHASGEGLIVIYPVSAHSVPARTPASGIPTRMPMPIDHDLLAYAIVFPHVPDTDGSQGTFVSVRPIPVMDEPDEPDTEEIPEDTEDEA